jgi:hypothetical protein
MKVSQLSVELLILGSITLMFSHSFSTFAFLLNDHDRIKFLAQNMLETFWKGFPKIFTLKLSGILLSQPIKSTPGAKMRKRRKIVQ